ncbi:MAG: glycosyltransferase family 2 protein [Firmicutes bacterium]|nr:glycosyltransferase family 2 protein [Bacillota bacterium]
MARVLIIIPAYNEAGSIGLVLDEIRTYMPTADVLVVSDGSTDDTAAIARERGAMVVELPHNLGIGGAMQTGYRYAARHRYQAAVQVDADGQHDVRELPPLLTPVLSGEVDLAIGSRYVTDTGYRGPLSRRIGSWLLAHWVRLMTGQMIHDPTSGFRVAGPRAIALFAEEYPVDYPEVESLVLLIRRGLTVREWPVRMRPRLAGRSSITPLKSVEYMIKVGLAVWIQRMRREVT